MVRMLQRDVLLVTVSQTRSLSEIEQIFCVNNCYCKGNKIAVYFSKYLFCPLHMYCTIYNICEKSVQIS